MFFTSILLILRIKEAALLFSPSMPKWQEISISFMRFLLLLVPLSGIMSIDSGRAVKLFGMTIIDSSNKIEWLAELTRPLHYALTWLLATIVLLHVIGAIKR